MKSDIKELYRVLDLEPGANLAAVRQAYRQLVKVWHPDRFGHDQTLQAVASEKLKKINSSYEAMVTQFRECRVKWFSLCIRLLKDESGLRSNPQLAERAEVATWVCQCADALEFIAARRYISPENGRDFANQLFAAMMTEGPGEVLLAHQLYKLSLAARRRNDAGSEIMELCRLVAERILLNDDYSVGMTLATTIPLFTNINNSVVAQAFGDDGTLRQLEKLRENC